MCIHYRVLMYIPQILHILTSSPRHAQKVLKCGLQAGFRESGAHGLVPLPSEAEAPTPMVGIRTMGLGFESLIGYQSGDHVSLIVDREYLDVLVDVANERFVENAGRIERFRKALLVEFAEGGDERKKGKGKGKDGGDWEDAATRRERKRIEGLRRAEETRKGKGNGEAVVGDGDENDDFMGLPDT